MYAAQHRQQQATAAAAQQQRWGGAAGATTDKADAMHARSMSGGVGRVAEPGGAPEAHNGQHEAHEAHGTLRNYAVRGR